MPTFDITSTFDKQEVTNAVDQMNRELVNRYDFRGTNTTAILSDNNIIIKSSTEERMNAADQVLKEKFVKRNVSIKFLSNFEDEKTPSESKKNQLKFLVDQFFYRDCFLKKKNTFLKILEMLKKNICCFRKLQKMKMFL